MLKEAIEWVSDNGGAGLGFLQKSANPYSHKSVLRYFKPESQINTAAVLPLNEELSSSTATATLAPDEKPAKRPSSLANRRAI